MGPIWRVFFLVGWFVVREPPQAPHSQEIFVFFFPGFSLWASFWKHINWWNAKSEGFSTTNNPVILRIPFAVLNSSSFRNGKYMKIPNDQIAPPISHASQSWPKCLCIQKEKTKTLPAEVGHTDWTQVGLKNSLKFGGFWKSVDCSNQPTCRGRGRCLPCKEDIRPASKKVDLCEITLKVNLKIVQFYSSPLNFHGS